MFKTLAKPISWPLMRNLLSRTYTNEATSATTNIIVEKNGVVTLIGINRPEVVNCINLDTASELRAAITNFEKDESSPIGVLHGIGGNFCSGFDMSEVTKENASLHNIILKADGVLGPTRRPITKPLICAISGYCVAGGLELALMCDMRVMEDNAIIGFFNRRFGVPLVDGGTARLSRLIGLSRALDLVLTGRPCKAKEALEFGIANRIVASGTALGQSLNLANNIAKFPQKCLTHDRNALLYSAYDSNNLLEAIQYEVMTVDEKLFTEIKSGASSFLEYGVGRGGKFSNIKARTVPDWESEEIEMEKSKKPKDDKE